MKPLARTEQIIVERLGSECVLYDCTTKMAHSLNHSATWIWHHCDGAATVEELAALFEAEFGVTDALPMIYAGLKDLRASNLLATPIEAAAVAAAEVPLSRRSVLVTTGAVFAPVVTSIVAPTAAAAKSNDDKDEKIKDKDKVK